MAGAGSGVGAQKRRKKSGLKSIETLPENLFWKVDGCRNHSSTLVGRTKVSAKLATRRKALKSTGSTTARDGTNSDGRSQKLSESGRKKRELQRRSGKCKEVSSSTPKKKAYGAGVTSG